MSDDRRRIESYDDTPLVRDEITTLFRGFLRYPSLLKDAINLHLEEARFNHDELLYLVVFSAARELYTQYGVVTRDMLVTQIATAVETGGVTLTQQDAVFLFGPEGEDGFIDEAFNTPLPDAGAQRAERAFLENVLKRFLQIRLIKINIQSVINRTTENSVPARIQEVIERWGQVAQRVERVGEETFNAMVMPDFGDPNLELPPPATATGIAWLDQYIGGIRAGEIIGVLGPYGGGKTTVLSVAAVRMAELYASRGEPKLSLFIGYEDGHKKMNPMFQSAASRIDRNMFYNAQANAARFWAGLSDRNNLKDYERRLPENSNGEIMFGERERWEAAKVWIRSNFFYLDHGCNIETGRRGDGGVSEIVARLERLIERTGMSIGFIAIDYAKLLIERSLDDSKTDPHALTRPLAALADELKRRIAMPMDATIMLAHQLAPNDVKNKPVYQYVDHFDAANAKSFAENLHSCLCVNKKCPATRVSTINWSKIRVGLPPCGTPYGLIRMDDVIVDAHLVNDLYIADAASRAILRRGDVRVAAPVDVPPAAAGAGRRPGWSSDSFAGDI